MTEQEELELAEAEAEAAQAEPVSEPAPAPGVNDRSFVRGPTSAQDIDENAFQTVGGSIKRVARGLVSGVSGDLPAAASRLVPDSLLENSDESAESVREQYQNPQPGAYMAGAMLNPIASLPGSASSLGNAAWQAGQAGFSSLARGEGGGNALKNAAIAGGGTLLAGSLLPKILGPMLTKEEAAAARSMDNIERIPQEDVNAAYLEHQRMRSADPETASKTMFEDPNYVRQEVMEFNRGRDGTFDISPSAQDQRALANRNDAELQRASANAPLVGQDIPIRKVTDPLQTRERDLVIAGRDERAVRIRELLAQLEKARAEQDLGRSAATIRGNANPLAQSVESVPVPGGGISGPKTQSIPNVDPVTGARGMEAVSALDNTATIPGQRIAEGITDEIRQGRAVAGNSAKPSVEKGSVDPAYIESSGAFQDVARNVMKEEEYAALQEAIQRAKAAEEASMTSTVNRLGGLAEPNARGGFKTAVASSVSNPILSRWRMFNQNRIVDRAIANLQKSDQPQYRALAEWISSAGSPTGVAARSFVAAKQNPEFLKMIQEGDKDE